MEKTLFNIYILYIFKTHIQKTNILETSIGYSLTINEYRSDIKMVTVTEANAMNTFYK